MRLIIGLDDTDMPDTPGTNQLARRTADALPPGFTFDVVLRHQLLLDPRIPYTTHNGCASIGLRTEPGSDAGPGHGAALLAFLRGHVSAFAPPGSDPGLCILEVPDEPPTAPGPFPALRAFAERCQREPVRQADALELAREHRIHLEPLGGTGDGIIGALAAVALRAGADDGRVVHRPGWPWPDPFAGPQAVTSILSRGVDEIRTPGGQAVRTGIVYVGKHLRPAFRRGRVVLFVEPTGQAASAPAPAPARWNALKLP